MTDVRFTFHGNDGTDDILVRDCPTDLLTELVAAQAGQVDPEPVFTIVCSANGGPERSYVFRAGRIRDVREVA